jgi:hypothetical protein
MKGDEMAEKIQDMHEEMQKILDKDYPLLPMSPFNDRGCLTVTIIYGEIPFHIPIDFVEWKNNTTLEQRKSLIKSRFTEAMFNLKDHAREFVEKYGNPDQFEKLENLHDGELTRSCMNCSSYGVCRMQEHIQSLSEAMGYIPFSNDHANYDTREIKRMEIRGEVENIIAKHCEMYQQKELV